MLFLWDAVTDLVSLKQWHKMSNVLLMNVVDLVFSWVDHPSNLQWTPHWKKADVK